MRKWRFYVFSAIFISSIIFFSATGMSQTVDITADYSGSQWWGNLTLTIKNNGTEAIDGWELGFVLPYSITWFNGANIKSHSGSTYVLVPNTWGGSNYLSPGENVTISGGFSPSGSIPGDDQIPSTFIFNGVEIGDTQENNSPVANDDNITVTAGESIPINVLKNDSDPDGDPISIISISNSLLKGSASISGDTIVYEAYDNVSGTENLSYIISDGNGETDSATVNITINEKPNVHPTVTITEPVDETVIEQENLSEVTIKITPFDTDGTIVSSEITVDNKTFNGETIGWLPSAFGTYEIIARTKDNKGAEASASSTVTIKKRIVTVNNPPIAYDDNASTKSNSSVTIDILGNDTDADGDSLTILSVTSPANGKTEISNNKVIYTPVNNFFGSDTFGYIISDGKATAAATVTVNVEKIVSGLVTVELKEDPLYAGNPYWFCGDIIIQNNTSENISDWELEFDFPYNIIMAFYADQATGNNAYYKLTPSDPYRTETIYANSSVSIYIYAIRNSNPAILSNIYFNGMPLNKQNNSPVANPDTAEVSVGENVIIDVLANDNDQDGDELEITSVCCATQGNAVIIDNKIVYSPNSNASGMDGLIYTINDGNEGIATSTVNITINPKPSQSPVISFISPKDGDIIEQNELSPINIEVEASDPDGGNINVTIDINGQTLSGTTVSWTPTEFKTYNITATATDDEGDTATALIAFTIAKKAPAQKQIIGYMDQWSGWKNQNDHGVPKGGLNHTNIDWSKYTIVNFSFFGLAKDGTLHSAEYRNKDMESIGSIANIENDKKGYNPDLEQEPGELIFRDHAWSFEPYFFDNDLNGPHKNMFEYAKENNVKLLASIGGWSMCKHFAEVAADPVKRAKFVADCAKLIDMGFDGIDLDWEYPGDEGRNITEYSDEDYANFTQLVKEIRLAIGWDKVLTSCFICDVNKLQGFEWNEIDKYLDYFNVMSYDMNGGWSEKTGHLAPLYAPEGELSWNNVFIYLTETAGIDSEKINMGVPFYGRGVVTDGTANLNVNTYKEYKPFDVEGYINMAHDFDNFDTFEGTPYYSYIMQKTADWSEKWDETSKTPYKIKDNYFLSFENEASIAAKAKYVVDHNAGGVIIFGTYGDIDFSNAAEVYTYGDKVTIQKYSGLKTPLLDIIYSIFENGGGNIKPEIKITGPSDGHVIITDELSEMMISGTAYDADGSIENIYAEIDGKIYDITLNNGSFIFSWIPEAFGNYEIKVSAEDNSAAISTAIISVKVKQTGSVTDDMIIIGYMNQWDAWKAPDKFDILPAKGAYNHLNVDMTKYDIINFSFFGVANDGSLHSGDLKPKELYRDDVIHNPGAIIHPDKYSSYDNYFFYGDGLRDIWWVSSSDAEYLEELGIEWTSSTWTDPITGELKSYPINVPQENGLKNMFEYAHESGTKILAAIGGWTMCKHFAQVAADPVKRATFVNECKTLLKMGFDGIDLDWEYPGDRGMNILEYSDEDYHNFTLLVKEIREAIGEDKLLTSCFSCDTKKLQKLEWSELNKYLDYFNIMSYDMEGGWSDNTGHNSSLYNDEDKHSWDKVFKYMTQTAGIEANRINMGIAFYGRSVETSGPASLGAPTHKTDKKFYIDGPLYMAHDFVNFENFEGTPNYSYLVEHTKDWTEHWDDKAKVPYKIKDNFFISYDNEESVRLKAEYVVDNNAAGVIIWQAYNDIDFSNAVKVAENEKIQQYSNLKTPLLDVIYNTFMNYSAGDQQPVVNITSPVCGSEIIQEQLTPIHINVNAYDPDGGNVNVIIEVDSQVFNNTSAKWTPSSFGTFTITATVKDDENNTQKSYCNITVKEDTGTSEAPVINFISPEDNAVIEQEELSSVTVKVNASDPDGTVEVITIEVDGQTFSGDTANWTPSTFGTFSLKATATDNDNISASKSITVEIKEDQSGSSEAPIISMASHSDGETIEQDELSPINIELNASDPDGGDVTVTSEIDGQIFNGSTITWTPSDFGTYNINITVTDDENQTATLLVTLTIKKKTSGSGSSVVNGWPDYIAMGAVTGGFKNDHINRPVDALFKYAGDGGNGDRGSIKYPIYTKNISSMTQELKSDYNKDVLPVMVVYTAEMSGGTNFADLHDYDNLTMHFVNLIHTCKILQATKSTDNPYPGSIVLNPDLLGMVQQNNLLAGINSQTIRVQDALNKAIHCVEDKVDYYNGSMMNPLEIFAELRQDAWSDWDVKNTWEQLVQNDIFPNSSEASVTNIPSFSDDFKGWIQATNFVIKHYSPDVTFGWQENLWSRGSAQWIHRDYAEGEIKGTICSGTIDLWSNLDVYSGQYKPDFIVFDKYERDPIPGFINDWLFNARDWDNYLEYVKQISIGLGDIPVMLWQLPGGHLQVDGDVDTRNSNGATAPVYFFGDENLDINLTNLKSYISQSVKDYLLENGYDWRQQGNLQKLLECNVFALLWGGGSTTSVGTYPSDDGGWLSNKINNYYTSPIYLDGSSPENRAPVANTDSASLYPGEITVIDVLSNDNDPDNDPIIITAVSSPSHGTAYISDNKITYSANSDANGEDNFTYTISDGNNHETIGTVNVTILSDVNTPPEASDDTISLFVDETRIIDVLANDSDIDGDALTIIDVCCENSLGNPVINNNKIEYTAYTAGTHSFTYTVSDGNGGDDIGNVKVIINEQQSTEPGEFIIGDVTVKFEATSIWWSDYQLSCSVSGNAPKGWTMQIHFDNGQTVNSAWGIATKGSAANELVNNNWSSSTGTFTASISGTHAYVGELPTSIIFNGAGSGGGPTNNEPVANNDTANVNAGESVTIDALNNDYDPDNDTLTVSKVTQGSKGSVQVIGCSTTCQIVYTADQGTSGSDSFTYIINDGKGEEDTATVTININSIENYPPEIEFVSIRDGDVIEQEALSQILIQINPKDSDGTIAESSIEVDNQIFAGNTANWLPSAYGSFNIVGKAIDNEGVSAFKSIKVTVKDPNAVIQTATELNVSYTISDTGSSYTINMTLANTSEYKVTSWEGSFIIPDGQNVSNIWGAELISQEQHQSGILVTVANPSWSEGLEPGASTDLGITVSNNSGTTADIIAPLFIGALKTPPVNGNGFPDKVFAPYVDVCQWPTPSLEDYYNETGQKYVTLAFVVSNGKTPSWGGYYDIVDGEYFYSEHINAIRKAGGDVIVSFGGANGTTLAQAIDNVNELVNAYKIVIDTYKLSWVDFDVEGAAVMDSESVQRRNQAIEILQQNYPNLKVSYCLPILPSGLTAAGLEIISNAYDNNVNIYSVNGMSMDFGDSAAPPSIPMHEHIINCGKNLKNQLSTIYQDKSDNELWNMIGLIPMIGYNDVTTEIVWQEDAETVLNFAQQVDMKFLSMWSTTRDHDGSANEGQVSPKHSGIPQEEFEFTNLFKTFTDKN